jgi:predicted dehydrogenase
MKRIGMGIVGLGFAGAHHIDTVRRLGYVDVVGVVGSSLASAKKKASEYNIPKAYGSYEELVADPDIQVVHNTSVNYLHTPVNLAAISRGKHLLSDKPLAMNSTEARQVRDAAIKAGIVHGVVFNYRGNPLVQQARLMISRGELGSIHFIHGEYLQDWLLEPRDYSWRLDPAKGGASVALGDIGSHWCDLAQHIAGLRIQSVLADLTTVVKTRQRPVVATETFQASGTGVATEAVQIQGDDLASVLLKFENGAKGCVSVGQVCAGHKNDLWVEVSGQKSSLRWDQEKQNQLWSGLRHEASQMLPKDPALIDGSLRKYARLPGGHQEGWSDALRNVLEEFYAQVMTEGKSRGTMSPLVATFEDGYRANRIVDSMLESHAAGGIWKRVEY